MRTVKIVIEKWPDGYVGHALGIDGAVVGQGDTYEEALADVSSAIRFHIQTFGDQVLDDDGPKEVFLAEVSVDFRAQVPS